MVRHFLGQNDLTAGEMEDIFARTTAMKPVRRSHELEGRSLVMFFEKSSTRTRLSFEIGMTQLGGHAVYLDRDSSQLSRGESIEDTARVVSRYADLMMARVFAHRTIECLASVAGIPVINGLSDEEHPCQSMADLFTILEWKGRLRGVRIAYVGDGNNNVTHSLMLGAVRMGAHLTIAAPQSLLPDERYVERAQASADESGGSLRITEDAVDAVSEADVVYTDVWVSMGREDEKQARLDTLAPYQVNEQLVAHARPDYVFMHCLPAHIGEEVTGDVAYGPNSVIFDQAENRLHVQKALMVNLIQQSEGAA
ncbi:MAG TPA: ornithine carbamoyltransferase [Chloroflexota bacterium]